MKFKNFIFNVLAVSVAITVFVACDDDNESPRPEGDKGQIPGDGLSEPKQQNKDTKNSKRREFCSMTLLMNQLH